MFDFIQLLYDLRHKPVSFVVIAGIIFIIDRLGRTFITSQVRRLFHVDEQYNFKQYAINQKIIMENQIRIMKRMGIEPCDIKHIAALPKKYTVTNSRTLLILFLERLKRRMEKVRNINKALLIPLLSAIALFVKEVWGYSFTDEQIDMYADFALYIIMFIGLFMKPKKEGKPKDVELDFTDSPNA